MVNYFEDDDNEFVFEYQSMFLFCYFIKFIDLNVDIKVGVIGDLDIFDCDQLVFFFLFFLMMGRLIFVYNYYIVFVVFDE